ncbi:MAG: carboxymuconolactone decarboxylase family protein [Chloroflexi bacterium]|nr:carboxymuconolactone decarboxylase family protein [Chloroflexota bacterium]
MMNAVNDVLTAPQSEGDQQFSKRIYTPRLLIAALKDLYRNSDEMRSAMREGRISKAFSERIMLAVTAVNGCRYCSYAHAKMAQKSGISQDEVERLLGGDVAGATTDEAPALFFAQHYAERDGHPDPDAWQHLVAVYGEEVARDVLVHIRMITMGNLSGNSLDALLSRLRGRPAPESSLLGEIVVLGILGFGTPLLAVAIVFKRLGRALGQQASGAQVH